MADLERRETPQERYDRKNRVPFVMRLNKKTDGDILKKLETVPNKTGYVKQLIRADIAREEGLGD